jgi:outer membrane receptor protein involved in Fe transport
MTSGLTATIATCLCFVSFASTAWADDFSSAFQKSDTLISVLTELKSRGYQISYSSNVVLPNMRLQGTPKASDFESLMQEILAPWQLSVIKAGDNDYLVVGARKKEGERSEPRANLGEANLQPALDTIDVTATRFGIAGVHSDVTTTLTAEDVQRIPHLADDAMRVLKTLPGVAGRDLSAKINVRGGRRDELIMLIDGAEIHNGFHFQNGEDGVFSLVDTNMVQSMDFTTGGMPAKHGDAMSAILDIETRTPTLDDEYRHALGMSFISSFARTSRMFAAGRGSWIASARRSYLDLLMEEVQDSDERLTPEYQDVFTALRYDLSERTSLSARALLGSDDLTIVQDDRSSEEAGEGETSHLWLTLDHAWSGSLQFATVLSWATGDRQRDNFEEREQAMIGDAFLNAEFEYLDLRQDWQWLVSEDHMLSWGVSASRHDASYDYGLQALAIDPFDRARVIESQRAIDIEVSGDKFAVYGSYRTRLGHALTIEAGARWDSYRYEHGQSYTRASPRFNAVYEIGERSELRAAWGVMHQPHSIDRLDVEDGETQFHQPESARQLVVGYALKLFDTMSLRVDAYRKDYSDLRPRYENEFTSVRVIAEAEADRIRLDASRARAQGIELSLRRDTREQWGGWLSYSYGQAEDLEDDAWRTRSWEQQHSVTLGVGRSGATWDVNLAAFYYSGAPSTPVSFEIIERDDGSSLLLLERGAPNSTRLGHYLRFDLRASRKVFFESSALTYYLEVFNLLNRDNPCCVDEFEAYRRNNATDLRIEYSYGFPRLPSFGFHYEF